jgi:uncharacterized damage-inducible protein DinB
MLPATAKHERFGCVTERKYPDMWVDPDDDPREPSEGGSGEKAVLAGYLRHYRLTLEMKCEGLDAEQLARRAVPPSTLSLLGLVRHLAKVEHSWFRRVLQGETEIPQLYWSTEDRDLAFTGAVPDPVVVEDAWASWRREVANAEAYLDSVAELGATVDHHGQPTEIRDIIVHLVEEYARHLGHADLLRECIDGRTGQ